MIEARINSVITLDSGAISQDLLHRILGELSIPNPDKDRAISEKIRGAGDMPDKISLWRAEAEKIILPRGFAHRFEQLANDVGESISWDSHMTILPTSEHCFRDWTPFELRDYQITARDAVLDWAQGALQLPTGGGKSATALETARWAGQKTIVLVHTTALARQWQEMTRKAYGYETGFIGEGQWEEKDLTICMRQTLWNRRGEIEIDGWFDRWGMVIADECHHASADTLNDLIGRFSAFYRIGLSATPKWDAALFPIVEAVIGPVIHKTTTEDVGEHLITPEVRQIETSFEHEYLPTRMQGHKRLQNNYTEIMSALVKDPERNDLIARIAREESQAGHHVLIVTRRIEHVKQLVSRLEKTMRIGSELHALTGAQTGADAQRIARTIENLDHGTVTISTVADEALDMPKLDRLIMAFPLRCLPLVQQQIGRVVRPASNKTDAIVYDITDPQVGPLKSQRKDRSQFYARRGWKLTRIQREDVHV